MLSLDFLGKTLKVIIDRPLGSKHPKHPDIIYEVNYGYVPNTVSGDNEEIDVYVLGVDYPIVSFEGQCIAVLHRIEEEDDKLIVVPAGSNFSDEMILTKTAFQERFFKSVIHRKKFSGGP